jgi:hypothetical protein
LECEEGERERERERKMGGQELGSMADKDPMG